MIVVDKKNLWGIGRLASYLIKIDFSVDLLILKPFFMCDKSLKGVQELQQILKTASKDGIDKETMDAKLNHMGQKLGELKDEIVKKNQTHKKELKIKDKEIRKSKETERALEEKIEQCKKRIKADESHKNKSFNHASGDKSEFNSEPHDKYALQRQTRKKRQAQQKVRECKKQIEELQEALAAKQRQNQRLKQALEIQKLLLDQFTNQKSEGSSGEQQNSQLEQQQLPQHQPVHVYKSESQMMDLSEGRIPQRMAQEEEEPRKLSQDRQTDDQQDDDESDSYCQKLIHKAQQNQTQDKPLLAQIKSQQSSDIKMEDPENSQKENILTNSSQVFEPKQPAKKIQKSTSMTDPKTNAKDEEESEPKTKGWFSWQTWFGKSSK